MEGDHARDSDEGPGDAVRLDGGPLSAPKSDFDAWARRRIRWTLFGLTALVALLIIGMLIAIAVHLSPIDGVWMGTWAFIASFAIAQIVVPGWMIEWRARQMAGGPAVEQSLGRTFTNMFGVGTVADSRSKLRMRLVGGLNLVAGTALVALIWWAGHRAGLA